MTKRYRVQFHPRAQRQLQHLHDYIAGETGPNAALGFVERIEKACLSLDTFPFRGADRSDLAPGLRTFGIERRVVIAFRVLADDVIVEGVFYGGQAYEDALRDPTAD